MSLRSMTGFGRATGGAGAWEFDVTVRSVNHRFLDVTVKLRDELAEWEAPVRRAVASRLTRGKVDVAVRARCGGEASRAARVDEALLADVVARIRGAAERLNLAGELSARDLLLLPGAVQVEAAAEPLDAGAGEALLAVVADALDRLCEMREREGEELAADLARRAETLAAAVSRIGSRRAEIVAAIAQSIRTRIAALLADLPLDPARVAQEAALLADRSDIAEELTRLSAHLSQFRGLVAGEADGGVGRRLDFLVQEIAREINTLGVKARDLPIVREVLEMKTEAEKIREQVQNIE